MIRHGEKEKDANGNDKEGLSPEGKERANYLPHVFGIDSQYNIGKILVQRAEKG
jgi:hypothetical protein